MNDPKLTQADLDRIAQVEKDATPGLWFEHFEARTPVPENDPDMSLLALDQEGTAIFSKQADINLLLEMRNNIPELLQGYNEWLRIRAKLTQIADTYRSGGGPGIMAQVFEDIRDNKA